MKISILGAGAWGTALAKSLSAAHDVCLWAHEAAVCQAIRVDRQNKRYLPGHVLQIGRITDDLNEACRDADLLIIATPVAGLRGLLSHIYVAGAPFPPCLWVCKGFEAKSGLLPHQVVADVVWQQQADHAKHSNDLASDWVIGALSGPSFAEEVALGRPTALVLASNNIGAGQVLSASLNSENLRIYSSDDMIGVEVGGAVKNVMAIASGVCDGLALGNNTRAALITRGLAEMTRLGVALGARPQTFMGLSGIGDLLLTCTGDLSRNRQVGLQLAKGRKLPEILQTLGHVAEGVPTTAEVVRLAQSHGVEMPISAAVQQLLQGEISAAAAQSQLLTRLPKNEWVA